MNRDDFEILSGFLRRGSGLSVTPAKLRLIENRLRPIAVRRGFKDVGELARALAGPDDELGREVADAMATHDTSFFRDIGLFRSLRETVFPELASARESRRRISVWCAGCSTGEEAYSLAMAANIAPQLAGWEVEIFATDISATAIERASSGVYTHYEVMQEGDDWRVVRSIRDRIEFRVFNLLDSFNVLGEFDIVLCRNVLIYFDQATKAQVLARISRVLAPDGYLVLGEAETVLGLVKGLATVPGARGVFAKTGNALNHRLAALG